jgi:hypothetical protein
MDRDLMRANLNLEWHREASRVVGAASHGEAMKLSRSYCKITPKHSSGQSPQCLIGNIALRIRIEIPGDISRNDVGNC